MNDLEKRFYARVHCSDRKKKYIVVTHLSSFILVQCVSLFRKVLKREIEMIGGFFNPCCNGGTVVHSLPAFREETRVLIRNLCLLRC